MHSKNEGKEKEVQDIKVLEVSINTDDAKVQSKPNFDSYKDLYKDVINDKCVELYGSLEDKDLWEDTAKEMYLQSEYYIPVKVEESKQESVKTNTKKKMNESVDWDYYDKFKSINDTYLPDRGQGETYATQIVTAINKLIYKWYNDGDVFDNNYSLDGWANDLSDYANWLAQYVDGAKEILDDIESYTFTEFDYEKLLKKLADSYLTDEFLSNANKSETKGDIYNCKGEFSFDENKQEEDYENEDDDFWGEDEDEELNESKTKSRRRLPNISKFIYDLDVDNGNAWSVQAYTENGLGEKIIIVYRNGESNNTAEDIKKAVEAQYDKLQGEITENGAGVWFYLKESLQEAVRIYPDKIKTPDGYILTKVDDGTYENAFIPMYRNENGDDTLITDIDKYEIVEDVTLDESSKKETTIGELLQQIEDATSVSEIYTIGTSVQDEVFTKVVDDEIEAIEAEYPDVYDMDEDTEEYGDILQNLISCITSDFGPSEYDNIVKLDEARKCEEKDSNYKVGDIVKVPYKYGSYTPGEYVNAPIIGIKDDFITVEIPSKLELTVNQLNKFQEESK